MGDDTWRSRKDKIRDAYYELLEAKDQLAKMEELVDGLPDPTTTPGRTGGAATPAVRSAVPSASKVETSVRVGSIGTYVMDTAAAGASTSPPTSGTSAPPTKSTSTASTVWQETPLGFVEHSLKQSSVDPSGHLVPGLPEIVRLSLNELAIGRNEPVQEVVQAIAEFYVEEEDERAEGPLAVALEHYVHNQLV